MTSFFRQSKLLFKSQRGAAAIAQTIVTRAAVAGINVGTGIISARSLGSTGRGDLSAMIVWPALLAYLLTLGLPSAMRYWIKREPERRSEFFTVSVAGGVLTSIVAIMIGTSFIPFWLRSYPHDIVRAAQLLMIVSPEIMLGMLFTSMLETIGAFATANRSRYVTVVLTLLALIVLSLAHRMTPFSAAIAYTGGPVLTTLWMGWILREHFRFNLFDPRSALRALSSYGFRSYGIDLLNTVATQIDQLLVIGFLSESELGIYVVALNASRVINILHSAVVTVLFPSAIGLEKAEIVAMVERSARVSTGIAILFAGSLGAVLPILLPLFYGAAFGAAIRAAELLTFEAVLTGLVSVLAQAFMALGRPGFVTLFQGVGLLAAIPLMLLLLPKLGMLGAAIALVLSTLLRLIFVIFAYRAVLHVPFPKLLPLREDFRILQNTLANRCE